MLRKEEKRKRWRDFLKNWKKKREVSAPNDVGLEKLKKLIVAV